MLTVYSKSNCPFCEKAINTLDMNDLKYNVVKVDEDPQAREFLIAEGHKSVPQIYQANGKLFVSGGYAGLKQYCIDNNMKI